MWHLVHCSPICLGTFWGLQKISQIDIFAFQTSILYAESDPPFTICLYLFIAISLSLGQNLTFGAHYFPIFETWHMICKLTRAILWICCHLSKTGDRLKFIQGESWFSAPSHILEWRRCSFFTTSTLSCAHYYVLKSSSCIVSWTDVKDSSSCIQLWTRVRLDCRI